MIYRTVLFSLALSIAITLASVLFQRIGPIQGFVGTECGDPQNKCYSPVLNGGFPIPFIIDEPTISIPGSLNLDDDIVVWPFLIDVGFYWIIFLVIKYVIIMRLQHR